MDFIKTKLSKKKFNEFYCKTRIWLHEQAYTTHFTKGKTIFSGFIILSLESEN